MTKIHYNHYQLNQSVYNDLSSAINNLEIAKTKSEIIAIPSGFSKTQDINNFIGCIANSLTKINNVKYVLDLSKTLYDSVETVVLEKIQGLDHYKINAIENKIRS